MSSMQVERRRGGGVPTWVLAALAVVLVAAFMAWLAMTAEPSNPVGANGTEEGDTIAQRAAQVPAVDLMAFADDPRQHEGTEVRLENVPVDSRLGERSFWLKLPNQGLYLVRGSGTVVASVQPGQRVTAVGSILPMSDSVVTVWIDEGSITTDQEMEARYATSYLDAWYVAPSSASAAQGESSAGRNASAPQ